MIRGNLRVWFVCLYFQWNVEMKVVVLLAQFTAIMHQICKPSEGSLASSLFPQIKKQETAHPLLRTICALLQISGATN